MSNEDNLWGDAEDMTHGECMIDYNVMPEGVSKADFDEMYPDYVNEWIACTRQLDFGIFESYTINISNGRTMSISPDHVIEFVDIVTVMIDEL